MDNINEIMSLTVENLAERQLKALQRHALEVLKQVEEGIKECRFDMFPSFESLAGDGYGEDNTCINFSYRENGCMDIFELLQELQKLEEVCKGNRR